MRFDVVSAVPQVVASCFEHSIVGRARLRGLVEISIHNLHDYASDRFRHIDDTPYGGGAGMILQCEPIFRCIELLKEQRSYDDVIYLCPDGARMDQSLCTSLSLSQNIIVLAGHYKGIDQRVRDVLVTREVSIGDFVVSGGEIPAALLIDAIVRLLPGSVGDAESVLDDSFMDGLLDPPHYTKPASFRGLEVPEVLRSGDHQKVAAWRKEQALEKTRSRRPDLLSSDSTK